jgi:hypothetical protein
MTNAGWDVTTGAGVSGWRLNLRRKTFGADGVLTFYGEKKHMKMEKVTCVVNVCCQHSSRACPP